MEAAGPMRAERPAPRVELRPTPPWVTLRFFAVFRTQSSNFVPPSSRFHSSLINKHAATWTRPTDHLRWPQGLCEGTAHTVPKELDSVRGNHATRLTLYLLALKLCGQSGVQSALMSVPLACMCDLLAWLWNRWAGPFRCVVRLPLLQWGWRSCHAAAQGSCSNRSPAEVMAHHRAPPGRRRGSNTDPTPATGRSARRGASLSDSTLDSVGGLAERCRQN